MKLTVAIVETMLEEKFKRAGFKLPFTVFGVELTTDLSKKALMGALVVVAEQERAAHEYAAIVTETLSVFKKTENT